MEKRTYKCEWIVVVFYSLEYGTADVFNIFKYFDETTNINGMVTSFWNIWGTRDKQTLLTYAQKLSFI